MGTLNATVGQKLLGRCCALLLQFLVLVWLPAAGEAAPTMDNQTQGQPSFSCAAPSPVEAVICADPDLAGRDRTLAVLFAASRRNPLGTGPSSQLSEQRSWLRERNDECATARSMSDCLAEQYRYRLNDLAVAALFTDHAAAMAELARQSPQAARIYEAIYQYATIQSAAERARTVGSIIKPAFEAMRIHPEQDVPGVGHVRAFPEPLFTEIPTAEAASTSDQNFANFLYVAAGWYVPRPGSPLVIPCEALVRRPGLLVALGTRFSPSSDCKAMLPATPDFDHLIAIAAKAQPPCRGSIRFDLGAVYKMNLTAIRLNILGNRNKTSQRSFSLDNISEIDRNFRATFGQEIKTSTVEMAHYYLSVFHLPLDVARSHGRYAVDEAVSGAFDQCA